MKPGKQQRKRRTKRTLSTAEDLLSQAQVLQTAYWKKLTELETEIGVPVDSTQDLSGMDMETLIALGQDEEERMK